MAKARLILLTLYTMTPNECEHSIGFDAGDGVLVLNLDFCGVMSLRIGIEQADYELSPDLFVRIAFSIAYKEASRTMRLDSNGLLARRD